MPQGLQALRVGLDARKADRHGRDRHAGRLPEQSVRREVRNALGRQGQRERDREPQVAGTVAVIVRRGAFSARRHPGCERLRYEAGLADGLQRMRDRAGRTVDAQRSLAELEVQGADARDRLDGAADLRFLHAAVHRRDAEGVGADRTRRHGLGFVGMVGRAAGAVRVRVRMRLMRAVGGGDRGFRRVPGHARHWKP